LEEIAQYGRIDSLQPPLSFLAAGGSDAMPYASKNNISILASSSSGIVDWEI